MNESTTAPIYEWALVGGMALITFVIRYGPLALGERLRLSPLALKALQFVPPAVLIAIVVPAALMPSGSLWLDWHNPRLVGAIAALLIGLWRQNLLLTIVGSMAVFLLWQLWLTPSGP